MEKYESVLKFEKYIINEVNFKGNKDFKQTEERTPVDLKIKRNTQIDDKDKKMEINLKVDIFDNAKENNYPFEIKVDLTGYFYIEEGEPKSLEKNAIAILYPYIRSLISTYTVNSSDFPLMLPAINVNKLIEDQKED